LELLSLCITTVTTLGFATTRFESCDRKKDIENAGENGDVAGLGCERKICCCWIGCLLACLLHPRDLPCCLGLDIVWSCSVCVGSIWSKLVKTLSQGHAAQRVLGKLSAACRTGAAWCISRHRQMGSWFNGVKRYWITYEYVQYCSMVDGWTTSLQFAMKTWKLGSHRRSQGKRNGGVSREFKNPMQPWSSITPRTYKPIKPVPGWLWDPDSHGPCLLFDWVHRFILYAMTSRFD